MNNNNIVKSLDQLAKMFGKDRLITPEEIDKVLAGIVSLLTAFKKSTEELNAETKATSEKLLATLLEKYENQNKSFRNLSEKQQTDFKDRVEEMVYLIQEFKKMKPKDGVDGVSPKLQDIIDGVLQQVKIPQPEQFVLHGEDIIDKINELELTDENKIDWDRIKNIPSWLFENTIGKGGMSPTVIRQAVDLDHSTRVDGYGIVWDEATKRHKYSASGGGGGSGTVNSGAQYRLAYYATAGTAVSNAGAITASRVLVSDANGVPTHSAVTTTTLGYLDATSSIQTQLDAKGTGNALTSNPLSQFAATTSAQLAGIMSDETGSGALVFANSPVFTTPNIGSATGSISGNAGTATALANARTIGGVSFDGTANITVATATGGFTISGGNLALTTNSITMTGSLAETGARVTKGWFTDIESTNMPTVGGVAILTSLTAPQFTTIELGHATDTTLARSSAGVVTIEGVVIDTISAANTLTNKTLTAPKFADLGFIADSSGNELLIFDLVASAVNEVTLGNASTGNSPFLVATGGDTDIGFNLSSKGAGSMTLWSGNLARELLILPNVASAVNEITIRGGATGTSPAIESSGGDSNLDLKLVPKGTGIVKGELKRFQVRLVDSTTALTTGTAKGGDYRISNRAITVKAVGAYVDTAATGGTLLTIDINEAGTTIISTKITLDASEKTSETAATPPVISDSAIAADAIVTFDIDAVGSTVAGSGLVVWVDYVYA